MSEAVAEYPKIDKSSWPRGAWDDEPDRVDFVHAGYACLILRHPRHGYFCGYVGVDDVHPWFRQSWIDLPQLPGYVDYSDVCDGRICHTAAPGMPETVWWFGFSCSHGYDFAPGLRELPLPEEVYCNLAYARQKTEQLAEELRAKTR